MKRKLWSMVCVLTAMLIVLSACSESNKSTSQSDSFKVVFIYFGLLGDLGWTYEHDQGRRALDERLGDAVQTEYIENAMGGEDAARILRQYAQEGYDMIFATSPAYTDRVYEVSQEFPEVNFENCGGDKTNVNMAAYYGRMYQPRYLSGIVAGRMTQNNVIGYVASYATPEVIRGLNAFALGVRSVNPVAEVRVIWTNTWDDPEVEREKAVALLDQGADIIAQHQDTTEPQRAAQERGALSIGYDSDMRAFVGDTVLISPIWNWSVYYEETVRDALNGNWTGHQYWGGLKEGIVALSEFSPKVPQDVRNSVAIAQDRILAGQDVFCGPIRGQNGNEIIPAGLCLSDTEMLSMDFLVEGVVGNIPESQ